MSACHRGLGPRLQGDQPQREATKNECRVGGDEHFQIRSAPDAQPPPVLNHLQDCTKASSDRSRTLGCPEFAG